MLKKITAKDLYELRFLSAVSVSPDKSRTVFTVTRTDEASNSYISALWIRDNASGSIRQLTADGKYSDVSWQKDGSLLFSCSSREKAEKDHTLFYRLPAGGGEAVKAFDVPGKVRSFKALGDGKYMALCRISMAEAPDERPYHAQIGVDFEVFDELPFWSNGEGITNKTRDAVFVFDEADQSLNQISLPGYKTAAVSASPCGRFIAFSGCMPDEGVYRQNSGLWLYDIKNKELSTIEEQGAYSIDAICFWNGELFYQKCLNQWPGVNPLFCCASLDDLSIRTLPYADASVGGSATTDSSYGGGSQIRAVEDKLYMIMTVRDDDCIMAMDKDGNLSGLVTNAGSVSCFDVVDDKLIYVAMRGGLPCELFEFDLINGNEKRLSGFNDEFVNTHRISIPRTYKIINRDGWELDGFLLEPAGYEPGKKYPGVLEIHGGPKGVYGDLFNLEMQMLSAEGFFVFYTNPRGGDGRGDSFANITGQLGGIDFNDLMDFTEATLKLFPDIDEDNLACCGGSYGGFMVNWMVGHTDRFKAACAQRSISNYLTKPFTTDIGYYHNIRQLEFTPWESFDTVWEHSPLKNAHLARTATLFIQSEEDYRCWMTDALQMYMAMRKNSVDCRMAFFKGENHNLSRTGRPHQRVERLTEINGWFCSHLDRQQGS